MTKPADAIVRVRATKSRGRCAELSGRSTAVVRAGLFAVGLLWPLVAFSSEPLPMQSSASKESAAPSASPNPPASPPRGQQEPAPSKPRSLDELLDVPGVDPNQGADGAPDAAEDEQAKRLQRSLDEATLDDLVARAVDGMKSASERLVQARDPGIGTQRIQEDVVRTLDRLLEEANKQQKQKQKSSSSSSRRNSQQRNQGEKDEPQEQNGQESGRADARQRDGDAQRNRSSPDASQDASDETRDDIAGETGELDETRIEWGRLPERVREMVLQGRRDRVSTIYERLTREYYRRLAEEASK